MKDGDREACSGYFQSSFYSNRILDSFPGEGPNTSHTGIECTGFDGSNVRHDKKIKIRLNGFFVLDTNNSFLRSLNPMEKK